MHTEPQLTLELQEWAYGQLCALLPPYLVRMRQGSYDCPCAPSMAFLAIRDALAKGYTIDRSNGEAELTEWDGWLVLDTPGEATYIQTTKVKI